MEHISQSDRLLELWLKQSEESPKDEPKLKHWIHPVARVICLLTTRKTMDTNRLLRVARMLLVSVILCTLPVVTERSALGHGGDISEMSPSQSSPSSHSNLSSPETAGLQAASWALTIPYGAVKMAYAIGGGVVGGLTWAMTGGNMGAAKSIWIPSMTGDYIVQPQHLTGEKHLFFVGASGAMS